jgi:phosphoglycerate dehydrogenase-like enzyme
MTSAQGGVTGPRLWFERAILPELVDEVAASATILGPGTAEDPYAGLGTAEGALASGLRYDAALMDRGPLLRVIARTGIGYDNVDVAEATRRGIAVCNTPDGPTISTAEHAVALLLMVAKGVKPAEAGLAAQTGDYYSRHRAVELDGKVLGLVGYGRIARRVAQACLGLGMRVIAYDPNLDSGAFPADVSRASSVAELLGSADVVSVHVPLSDHTRGMFGRPEFAQMKRGAIFVNTARGGLVDGDALLEALDSGQLFGAGLDVTEPEPLPGGHPLLLRDDVVVTPHVASATVEGKVRIFRAAMVEALTALRGEQPANIVNPEAWDSAPGVALRSRAR